MAIHVHIHHKTADRKRTKDAGYETFSGSIDQFQRKVKERFPQSHQNVAHRGQNTIYEYFNDRKTVAEYTMEKKTGWILK